MKQPIGYRLTYGLGIGNHREMQDFFSLMAWSDAVRYMEQYRITSVNRPTIGPLYERI